MAIINFNRKYKWDFENIGGTSRVKISTGEDIAHLPELDPKMWTVLSCPVKGLEIDEKSLVYMDADGDGKIRVQDVISTAKWVVDAVNDPDLLLKGEDGFDVDNFSKESELGKNLSVCAGRILESLGKQGGRISISDVSDISAIFAKTTFNGDGVIIDASADDPDQKAVIASAEKDLVFQPCS